ncbi:MAG: RNA-guided endonuclease InsQ/TnpB family protein [Promethearchaeota archaeon]
MLTQKIRIVPTPQQEEIMWALSEKCRLLYNFALAERRQNWEINRRRPKTKRNYITYSMQQNALPSLKDQFPEYKWVYSKVLQMTLQKLDADFKSFYVSRKKGRKDARPPRFKGKKFFTTLCYNQSGFNINIERKTITFTHRHPSKIVLEFALPWLSLKGEIKQVEIVRDAKNRWFVAITVSSKVPTFMDNGLYQAIDLGITNLITAVNMHGRFIQIQSRRPDLYWRKKLREVQSRRDYCQKSSKKWHFYHRKWKKMYRKLANQMRDFQHKISKVVITNSRAHTFIIGNIAVKSMAQRRRTSEGRRRCKAIRTLNHSIYNTGLLGRFAQFLTYKALNVGKRVIRIDEARTTKTCCVCGRIRNRPLSERTIQCNCGTPFNRDQNAAVNIMVRFLLQQPLVNGEPLQKFWNGLHRHTALSYNPWIVDSMETPA